MLVLALFGCGSPGPCGGDPEATLGLEDGGYTAFSDGDAVPVDVNDDGTYRFVIDARVQGLDPAEPVTGVVRVGFGADATQDFIGSIALTCTDAPAEYTFVTPFDAAYQDPDVIAGLDGSSFSLDASFTDALGTNASAHYTLALQAP